MYRLWLDETLYQIWTQSNYPRRSYCDFNIWPNDLEHVLRVARSSEIILTKFDLRQLICAWIIPFLMLICHVTLRLWPLTSWTWTLRLSYWWFSTFSPCNLRGWGTITERFSGVHGPNFTNLDEGIGQSFLQKKFVSRFGYLAEFSNAGSSELSDVENDAQFRTFWPRET